MENIEYLNSLYQVDEILKYIKPNLKARIPKRVISYFTNNKSKDFNWKIDKTLPLEEQELLPTTKEILSILYKDYMCDEIDKIKLDQILNENERKYQEELRKKYDPDNLFKNKQKNAEYIENQQEDTKIATYKESLLRKILNKIKLIFSK